MHDLIRGDIQVLSDTLDDKVLYKRTDLLPTYHLANIVDDYEMKISHVIRGEEWLPSLPLHYLLYRAFGWSEQQPEFAHLPLILKPSGNGKLSKRDGDKLGFPVFPLEWKAPSGEISHGYREDGYLPEAFLNMLALLGWNPGNEQELFTMDELIAKFSLERVSKNGARFDPEKAKWFNHAHLANASVGALYPYYAELLAEHGITATKERATDAIQLVQDRLTFLSDLWQETDYFWIAPSAYDEKAVKKHCNEHTPDYLAAVCQLIEASETLAVEALETQIKAYITANELPMGKVMNALRLALVGASRGIDVATIIVVVGKEEALRRIRAFSTSLF